MSVRLKPGSMERRLVEERWVSVEELAQHLGVARDTVYRWIERRGLPAHRVGRLWKFQFSEVDEWVKSGGADSVSAAYGERNVGRQ